MAAVTARRVPAVLASRVRAKRRRRCTECVVYQLTGSSNAAQRCIRFASGAALTPCINTLKATVRIAVKRIG